MARSAALPNVHLLHRVDAIEHDALVLDDGTLVAVLSCRSHAIGLRHEAEAAATVERLQRQLLALTWPIQLLVEVGPLDIDGFMAAHRRATAAEPHPLLVRLAEQQRAFVHALAGERRILEHRSAIILSVPAVRGGTRRWLGRPPLRGAADGGATEPLDERWRELGARCDAVTHLLANARIGARRLGTRELAVLLHGWLAPARAADQPLPADLGALATGPVRLRLTPDPVR